MMSIEILEIQSHLTNATNELTKGADYHEAKDFLIIILRALNDINQAKRALDALDFQESENLHGL